MAEQNQGASEIVDSDTGETTITRSAGPTVMCKGAIDFFAHHPASLPRACFYPPDGVELRRR